MRAVRVVRPALRVIDGAVPAGAALPSSQVGWLQAIEVNPATALLRGDAVEHLRAVARVLASTVSWTSWTTRPTWQVLQDRTGLSRRSVARWVAWLREHELLGVVESGTTARQRPMALDEGGNRAAVYVLAVPADLAAVCHLTLVDESGTPTGTSVFEGIPYAGARPEPHEGPLRGPGALDNDPITDWRWSAPARSGADRLALVGLLRRELPVLRRLSERHVRHLLRGQLLAGWTAADVRWALDHDASGVAYRHTAAVRHPAGWLAHRLGVWLDEHGTVRPPASAQIAAGDEQRRAAQAADRAEVDVLEQAITDSERSWGAVAAAAGDQVDELLAAACVAEGVSVPARLLRARVAIALTAVRRRCDPPAAQLADLPADLLAAAVHNVLAAAGASESGGPKCVARR